MACQAANLPDGAVVYPLVGTVNDASNALDQALPPPKTTKVNQQALECTMPMSFGSPEEMLQTCASRGTELAEIDCGPSFDFLENSSEEEFNAQYRVCQAAVQGIGTRSARYAACSLVDDCMPTGKCRDLSVLAEGGTLHQIDDFCNAERQDTTVTGTYYVDAGTQCVGPFTTHDALTSDASRIKTITMDEVPARQQECAATRGELYVLSCDADPSVYPQEDYERREMAQMQCADAVAEATTQDEFTAQCAAQEGCGPTGRCLFKPENSRVMAVPPVGAYDATDALKSIGDCTDEACTQVVIAPHYFDSVSGTWQRLQPGDSALGDYFLNENQIDRCALPMRYGKGLSSANPGGAQTLIPGAVPDMTVFSTCMERGDCEDLVHRLEGCATGDQSPYFQQTCSRPGLDLCELIDELHQRKTNGKQERTAPALARTCLRTKISKLHNGIKACAYSGKGSAEDFCKPWDPTYYPDDPHAAVQRAADASAEAYQQCRDDFNAVDDAAFERSCQVSEIDPSRPPCTLRSDTGDNMCAALAVMENHINTTMGYQAQANWQRVRNQTFPHIGCDRRTLQRLDDVPARCVARYNTGTTDASCMTQIDGAGNDADARTSCESAGCQYQPQRKAVTLLDVTNKFQDLQRARGDRTGNTLGFYAGTAAAAGHKGYELGHKLMGGTTDIEGNAAIAQARRETGEAQAAVQAAQDAEEQREWADNVHRRVDQYRMHHSEPSSLPPEPEAPNAHLARMRFNNAQAQEGASQFGEGGNAVEARPVTQQEAEASYQTAADQAAALDNAAAPSSLTQTDRVSGEGGDDADAEAEMDAEMDEAFIGGL